MSSLAAGVPHVSKNKAVKSLRNADSEPRALMNGRREVRVAPTFFEQLDRQLAPNTMSGWPARPTGGAGQPSMSINAPTTRGPGVYRPVGPITRGLIDPHPMRYRGSTTQRFDLPNRVFVRRRRTSEADNQGHGRARGTAVVQPPKTVMASINATRRTAMSRAAIFVPPLPSRLIVAAITLTLVALTLTSSPADAAYWCDGHRVTVDLALGQSPTDGNDVISGTADADMIDGLGGDDIICSFGGHDSVLGGPGNDRIFGGTGSDQLAGGPGRDYIEGASGNDLIDGGRDADIIYAGSNDDEVFGGDGNDTIHGQSGDDEIWGDTFITGQANMSQAGGDDRIYAGTGNDRVMAGAGADLVYGQPGNDRLIGGFGSDRLNGGSGNDDIAGGNGTSSQDGDDTPDYMYGNDGIDWLFGEVGAGDVLVAGGSDPVWASTPDKSGVPRDTQGRAWNDLSLKERQAYQRVHQDCGATWR